LQILVFLSVIYPGCVFFASTVCGKNEKSSTLANCFKGTMLGLTSYGFASGVALLMGGASKMFSKGITHVAKHVASSAVSGSGDDIDISSNFILALFYILFYLLFNMYYQVETAVCTAPAYNGMGAIVLLVLGLLSLVISSTANKVMDQVTDLADNVIGTAINAVSNVDLTQIGNVAKNALNGVSLNVGVDLPFSQQCIQQCVQQCNQSQMQCQPQFQMQYQPQFQMQYQPQYQPNQFSMQY
jgi:hypothetical protein